MSLRVEAGFEHLREALAEALNEEVEFPRGVLVTVLGAKITANTAHARITLSVLPTTAEAEAEVREALRAQDHEIKNALARRLRLRRIPRLHYVFDETEAHASLIDAHLHRLKETGGL